MRMYVPKDRPSRLVPKIHIKKWFSLFLKFPPGMLRSSSRRMGLCSSSSNNGISSSSLFFSAGFGNSAIVSFGFSSNGNALPSFSILGGLLESGTPVFGFLLLLTFGFGSNGSLPLSGTSVFGFLYLQRFTVTRNKTVF